MAGKPVVFLGPTLPHAEAAALLDAIYLPPAEQGSVVRAARERSAAAIVLVDGAFGKVPAVRHKEILWALASGIPVFGAASMGAIRAAELAPFGMRGHGFVFRWYAQTLLADDDEVAVAMSPPELGSAALSEALVNIRLTLARAQREKVVSGAQRRSLEALARETPFVDRSYPRLIADARVLLRDERAGPSHATCPGGVAGQGAPTPAPPTHEGEGDVLAAVSNPGTGAPNPPPPRGKGSGVGVFPHAIAPREWEAALDRLAGWLPSGAIDRKREDAVGLLSLLARRPEVVEHRPDAPPFRLTEAWAYDLEAAALWNDDIGSILAEQSR